MGKKKKPGFYCWRIEKFKVKRNDDAKNGIFYNDDSYIVLNGYMKDDKLLWDVHFWLGATTSQDEAGTAAYKTVELDDYLGGDPIQHREVSSRESPMFLSYYPHGIRLLEGGIESGFNHVKPESWTPRLLHVKGKKNIRVTQVPLKCSSLNSGDVFILDAGLVLYQYQGKKAGKNEKSQAAKLQRMIDDERKGKPEVLVFSQSDKASMDDSLQLFAGYFEDIGEEVKAGEPASLEATETFFANISADLGADDEDWEKDSNKRLLQLSDASGELEFKEVAEGTVAKSCLDSNDVFIFDIGSEIYVWIGKGASSTEKKMGMAYASKYLTKFDRPNYLPVTQIYEGGENEIFDGSFDS